MSDFLSTSPEMVAVPPPITPELAAIAAQEQAEMEAERLAAEELAKKEAEEQTKHFLAAASATPVPGTDVTAQDEVMTEVQSILEEHLDTYYQDFPEEAKARFLQKGREVGMEIANMVRTIHVNTKRVLHLIRDWLLTIPGVNKFFLEQEAKVKTDRIRALEADMRNRSSSS